jgi:hypothetical protein
MGKYLTDAKRHMERIRYFYEHAGADGYSQAKYHYHKLGNCCHETALHRHHVADASVIQPLYENATRLMAVMRSREESLSVSEEQSRPAY